jgi:hypothetical protein
MGKQRKSFLCFGACLTVYGLASSNASAQLSNLNLGFDEQYTSGSFQTAGGGLGIDNASNSWLWYKTIAPGGDQWRLAKMNILGNNRIFSPVLFEAHSTGAGCLVGADGNIYTAVNSTDLATGDKYFTVLKYNNAGLLQWQHKVLSSPDTHFTLLGLDADAAGNVYLAIRAILEGGAPQLETGVLNSAGTTTDFGFNTDINPSQAFHWSHTWVVTGTGSSGSATGGRWGFYFDSDATQYAGEFQANTSTDSYSYSAYPTTARIVLTARNHTHGIGPSATYSVLPRAFSITDGLTWWVGTETTGNARSMSGVGQHGPYYMLLAPSPTQESTVVQCLNDAGLVDYSSPVTADYVLADPAGIYTIQNDPLHPILRRYQCDSSIHPAAQWSNTFGNTFQWFAFRTLGPAFWIANNGGIVDVTRYVTGTSLSYLHSNVSSDVVGGHPYVLKVALSAPAPAGGMAVTLTSNNTHLLYPSGTISYTLAIPAGSLYALVNMTSTAVATNTAVTLTGVQNGVTRTNVVTLHSGP